MKMLSFWICESALIRVKGTGRRWRERFAYPVYDESEKSRVFTELVGYGGAVGVKTDEFLNIDVSASVTIRRVFLNPH